LFIEVTGVEQSVQLAAQDLFLANLMHRPSTPVDMDGCCLEGVILEEPSARCGRSIGRRWICRAMREEDVQTLTAYRRQTIEMLIEGRVDGGHECEPGGQRGAVEISGGVQHHQLSEVDARQFREGYDVPATAMLANAPELSLQRGNLPLGDLGEDRQRFLVRHLGRPCGYYLTAKSEPLAITR
jgi:hypothetical protein